MLSKRYQNDRRPILRLSKVQYQTLQEIHNKIDCNIYEFESCECPICNSSKELLLSEKDRYGLSFHVVICENCGLIRTNPRMNQKSYSEFYSLEYRRLYEGKPVATKEFFQNQLAQGRKITELFRSTAHPDFSNLFVLEVGCGAGGILQAFADTGAKVMGCDLGPDYLAYGRTHHNLDLRVGGLEELQLEYPPDLVIYSHVLEHIPDVNKELKLVRSIMPDSGFLYIEVPGVKEIHRQYNSDFLRLLQNAHAFHFSLTSLKNLLQQSGFKLISGNEYVEAFFQKSNDIADIRNDFQEAMDYLSWAEKWRKFYWMTPYAISFRYRSLRQKLIKILEKIRLKRPLRRLLGYKASS